MRSRRLPAAGILCALGVGAAFATCDVAADLAPGVRRLALAGLGIELGLAAVAVAGALLAAPPLAESLGLRRSRLRGRTLLALLVGTLALSHALDCLLELTGLREHSALAAFEETLAGTRGGDLALALLALALGPALGEELLCRGWIQRGLTPRLGPVRAVGSAAVIFGLLHLDPVHALFAVFLGLYLGVVACWGRSTWPSILCHGVNNAVAVLLAAGLAPGPARTPAGAVLGLALAGAALAVARPRPDRRGADSAHRARSTLQPESRSDDP